MEVQIVDFPETKVAAIEPRGSPRLEHESVRKLVEWRIVNRLPLDRHRNFGIHYNDPQTTPSADYRADFCISVDHEIALNPYGIVPKLIPAARCALMRHLGSRDNVSAAAYLQNIWLPQSGEVLGDFPMFFHYNNVGPHVQSEDMITDVYLPLQSGVRLGSTRPQPFHHSRKAAFK